MLWAIVALAAFFGTWFGVAYYGKGQQWSATLRWGGGFLAACSGISVVFSLLRDPPPSAAPEAQVAVPADAVTPVPAKTHNYSLKEGTEYGYDAGISNDAGNSGQVANKIIMIRFAGERAGKLQAFMQEKSVHTVMECERPCEIVKIMAFYQGEHVKTERIRANGGSLARIVMEDAMSGALKPSRMKGRNDSEMFSVWFDEQKGMTRTLVKP